MQRIPPEMTERARAMRREPTGAERRLWVRLRTVHPRFTRQLVVDRYVLDFACRTLRILVEADGGQHALEAERDAARTAYLEARGWTVLRFWNTDVSGNIDGVMEVIAAEASRASTYPQLLPFREGSRSRFVAGGVAR